MDREQTIHTITDHSVQTRRLAASLGPELRAGLLLEVTQAIYNAVKIDNPEGGGLDGRDGPERMGLAAVVDAAQEHHQEAYGRHRADREREDLR